MECNHIVVLRLSEFMDPIEVDFSVGIAESSPSWRAGVGSRGLSTACSLFVLAGSLVTSGGLVWAGASWLKGFFLSCLETRLTMTQEQRWLLFFCSCLCLAELNTLPLSGTVYLIWVSLLKNQMKSSFHFFMNRQNTIKWLQNIKWKTIIITFFLQILTPTLCRLR